MGRGAVARRVRWVVVFTTLLLASSAIPVFAADIPDEQLPAEAQVEAPVESGPVQPPDEDQVREGIEAAEREEAARERELKTPELSRQREESRYAFAGLSDADAQDLLLKVFPAQMAQLNADPARYLSDVEVLRTYGESAATVSDEGDGSLLEAGIPVRVENAEGQLEKVDLDLQETQTGFETANPLTDLYIPDKADEAIEVGQRGLAISAIGAEESEAKTLGEKNVWFSEVQVDTDLMVSPTASGVELFDQLRSADSPETLRFGLDLPEGAEVRQNGAGGAEISKDGKVFAVVSPPSAVDAQGTHVPVSLEVEGTQIALQVPHREGDFAYPILVDPAVREEAENAWFFGYALEALNSSIWNYSTNDPSQTYILHDYSCLTAALCSPSGRGLFLSSMNRNIPANVFTEWYYNVPGATTYIPSIYPEYSVYLNPFWRSNEGCSWNEYQQPHDFDGSYDANGTWQWLETDRAQWYGNASMYTKAKGVAFGISSGGGVNIPCWRDLMLGGTVIRLDDPEAPTLSSVTGIPSGWVSDTTSFTIIANASDPGLGVQNVTMTPEGRLVVPYTPQQNQCPGTKTHPCPASLSAQLNVNGDLFDEGEKGVKFSAYDPTGKTSGTISQTIRVDKTPPEVVLGGQLAVATEETEGDSKDPEKWDQLSLPVYKLRIEATDGSLQSGATKRSGVKSIEVFLDGKGTPEKTWTQTCPGSSCSMTQTYTLDLNELTADVHHTLKVITKDQVGKERKREIEFEYIPATGIKDEYVMQYFPLPDGQGNEAEEEHPKRPELAVNVMSGNLVYRESDIEVPGPAVDLEVERFYNSQLPDSENSEWGDGWTLAQTPELEPVDAGNLPGAEKANLLEPSGAIEAGVELPAEAEHDSFGPGIRATVTKKSTGGYELTDQTGETATSVAFDDTGQAEALLTESDAKVDYDYQAGKLDEIAVDDPGTTNRLPGEVEEPAEEADSTPTFTSVFGSYGTANGQLKSPGDVAIDAAGNIWVVDKGNNRIEKFNSKGEFVSKFGSTGSGNGQLSIPTSLAIDAQGNIWVAERGNNRIQKFSPSGEYLAKFGSKGSGSGQLWGPEGIAIDPKGNIWVSDTYNGRVQKFNSNGEFQKVVGSYGFGPGQLREPTGIDVGPGGKVWVTDWENNRVSVFNETGEFVFQFGTEGEGNGEFEHPDAIDVDAKGNVWVADEGYGRVQLFSREGKYVDQFGSQGSGKGQFDFTYPVGIATDDVGDVWITDTDNNRVQKWTIPGYLSKYTGVVYAQALGSQGSGDGQLQLPADVAVGTGGDLWVLDSGNNRIEKFNSKGEFVSKFGSTGSGNGQFKSPSAIAIDPEGNLLITDSGNNRVQKFNSKGEYLSQFGTYGAGNGQFKGPAGIAIGPTGLIFVADRGNHRVERFTKKGAYFGQGGSYGWEDLQYNEPTAIAIGPPSGESAYSIYVVDSGNNCVKRFTPDGGFLGKFGSTGSGNGQFNRPVAIDVDGEGNIWVGDRNNSRVQLFNEEGRYVNRFGASGSGEGQFSLGDPMGIAADSSGGVWVTDANNNRVQKWVAGTYTPDEDEEELAADDPSVQIQVTNGLVASVDGEETGEHDYSHSGQLLTAHSGPQGKTSYEYDSANRMTKVTLPNGTWGSIAYFSDGRVKSVTVDPAGESPAKTTHFEYSDEPRRTTVTPDGAPAVIYDIGADGSVLRWWNAVVPPDFDDVSGDLYFFKETAEPISIGDHNLVAQAHSEEGIASIEVIANGNQLVDEKTCEQDFETPGIECVTVVNEWVMNTGDFPPGILPLEVITTDRLGHSASERFWVNIPYTPSPSPSEEAPPKFAEVLRFREEFGLDLDLKGDELAINDRIFDLIGDWYNPQTPAGEVARASTERWGVPLRPIDVAELEYRDWYLSHDGPLIQQWGEDNHANTYAGYWMDHRHGGIIRVGFTSNQAATVSDLKQTGGLVALDRIGEFGSSPTHPVSELVSLQAAIGTSDGGAGGALAGQITRAGVDIANNEVTVGATNVGNVSTGLSSHYGAGAPILVFADSASSQSARYTDRGPVKGGQVIGKFLGEDAQGNHKYTICTAGSSAWERVGTKPTGEAKTAYFLLTAGHCFDEGASVVRFHEAEPKKSEVMVIGEQRSRKWQIYTDSQKFEDDGEAIRLDDFQPSPRIVDGSPVRGAGVVEIGMTVCESLGVSDERSCGAIKGPAEIVPFYEEEFWKDSGPFWQVPVQIKGQHGDSGSPVYSPDTGKVVGLNAFGPPSSFTPLLAPPLPEKGFYPYLHPSRDQAPGLLNESFMGDLHLVSE